MSFKPILFGCEGGVLSEAEAAFFAEAKPFGFILFKRNCETPDQIRALVASLRQAVGRPGAPVFIDQEGGPVARLKPPHWPELPAMRQIGLLYEADRAAGEEAAMLHGRITAHMLTDLEISGNFAPVADLYVEGATSAIGQRAISADPAVVASVAHIVLNAYLDNGIMPVLKHMPGHGRALVDPHLHLPVVETSLAVLEKEDFEPFRRLRAAPCAMTSHIVFKSVDAEKTVSLSRRAHEEILRGKIGFEGILFSDDLAMKALSGDPAQLALQALAAGTDLLLYCPGLLPEMKQIAAALPKAPALLQRRWERALELVRKPIFGYQADCDLSRLQALLARI